MASEYRFRRVMLALAAAGAMIALGAFPAAASDEPSSAATIEKIEQSTSSAMAWALQAKSRTRHARNVRGQPTRVASLARSGCGWYGWSACERPFILMVGIGF